MTPQSLGAATVRDAPVLRDTQDIGSAVETIVASDLPALPVVDANDRLVGIFGEREFITALFPGYVGQLRSAAFVPRSVEHLLQTRATCRREPVAQHMNREEVAVAEDYSDIQVAETFLHHRVLIVPIIDAFRHPTGLITRTDFFRALVDRLRPIT